MNRTRIEWCDFSWNPIKGLCPVGCWYCYAKKIYARFKLDPDLGLDKYILFYQWPKKPSKIFVCSTMELFHSEIPPHWRNLIFTQIESHPQHTFIILTKLPQNIDRPMPPNVWLGTTVTGWADAPRIDDLLKTEAKIKFVSYEPLLAFPGIPNHGLSWIIVGRLTGHGRINDPNKRWIQDIVGIGRGLGCPVFLKNNLKEIWGEPLIQEWPK